MRCHEVNGIPDRRLSRYCDDTPLHEIERLHVSGQRSIRCEILAVGSIRSTPIIAFCEWGHIDPATLSDRLEIHIVVEQSLP